MFFPKKTNAIYYQLLNGKTGIFCFYSLYNKIPKFYLKWLKIAISGKNTVSCIFTMLITKKTNYLLKCKSLTNKKLCTWKYTT